MPSADRALGGGTGQPARMALARASACAALFGWTVASLLSMVMEKLSESERHASISAWP